MTQTQKLEDKKAGDTRFTHREEWLLDQIIRLSQRVDTLESHERERQAALGRD